MSVPAAPVDGRTARGLRTRRTVVDALPAPQEEGDLQLRHDRGLPVAQAAAPVRRTVRRLVPTTGGPL